MFIHRIRVRYAETDKMGVVYYANYLVYLEEARAAFMRAIGYPYSKLEEEGIYAPVRECMVQYLSPLYYDDLFEVEVWVEDLRRSSFKFAYTLKRDGEILAKGYTLHVLVNKDLKPVKIPDKLKKLFKKKG